MARKKHLINVHSGTGTTAPANADLFLGEIAVQHTLTAPALWIKVGTSEDSNQYEKFIGETEILDLFDDIDVILGEDYVYSGLPYVNSASTLAEAYSALTNETLNLSAETESILDRVAENEYVVSVALNDLDDRIEELSGNTGAGAEPLSAAVISLSASVVNEAADITALSSATHTHVNDTDVHVTTSDKTTWSGKQDAISDLSTIRNNALSGASAYTRVNSLSSATVTLSGAAHTKITELSAATEAHITDDTKHLPTVTSSDNGNYLKVVNGNWTKSSAITVYVGSGGTPVDALGQNGDIYIQAIPMEFVRKPDVLYETDGTTGLLGINADMDTTTWQLTDLDFTPYKYVTAYIKQADLPLTGTDHLYATPSVVVTIPLDAASRSTQYDAYVGAGAGTNMQDRDVHFAVLCAIDSTKTKFKVLAESSIAGTISGDRNTNGRYCYKIVGYYD
jgi:hypothetical protein